MRTRMWGGMSPVLAAAACFWLTGCSAPARAASEAPPTAQQAPAEPAGPSGTPPAPSSSPAAAPAATAPSAVTDSSYVQWDPSTKTVTFRLVAGPFTFNGFGNGGATLTVPPGSANVWNFVQSDGTPHSAEIAAGDGPIPNSGGDPAIPRAYTNKVVEGLPQGATDVLKFTAPDSGSYRIICGVPGHALSGMWLWFKVDPKATTPTFGPTPE